MSEERCQQCNGVGEIMETAYGDVSCPHCGGTGIEPDCREREKGRAAPIRSARPGRFLSNGKERAMG